MNRFEVITPADLAHAARLLSGEGHVALAGGVDVIDLLKLDIIAPATLVNLKNLPELRGIESRAGGLRIGALTQLHEVAEHPLIREHYTAVAAAAREAATPQIRNLATVGGNLLQRPRCWYFRHPDVHCLKKGGDRCYAPGGLNRYHAILGGGPSFIVHPSNLAPALIAFGASAKIVGPSGQRSVELEKFFTLPTVDPRRENNLEPGEVVVAVELPAPPAGAKSAYLEAREKQSFDWPLVAAAAMLVGAPGSHTVHDARIVLGAVAPIPWRSPDAEKEIIGHPLDAERARAAGEASVRGAHPLSDNAYKVAIAKVLVRRAILKAAGIEET